MMIFVKESKDFSDKTTILYGRGGVGVCVGAEGTEGLVNVDQVAKLQEPDPIFEVGKLRKFRIKYSDLFD